MLFQKIFFVFALCVMSFGIILSAVYENSLPLMKELALMQARTVITRIVSDAAAEQGISGVSEYRVSDGGRIESVIGNAEVLNEIRAQVVSAIIEKCGRSGIAVRIPVGSLCGSAMLSGLGPALTVYFDGYGSVGADFEFENTPIGVNSGSYVVLLRVTVTTRIVFPKGESETVTLEETIPVERIIITGGLR